MDGVESMRIPKLVTSQRARKPPKSLYNIRYASSGESRRKTKDVIIDDIMLTPPRSSAGMIWTRDQCGDP